jgi:hypothetical protein
MTADCPGEPETRGPGERELCKEPAAGGAAGTAARETEPMPPRRRPSLERAVTGGPSGQGRLQLRAIRSGP